MLINIEESIWVFFLELQKTHKVSEKTFQYKRQVLLIQK